LHRLTGGFVFGMNVTHGRCHVAVAR
jgi:hypothetical protein